MIYDFLKWDETQRRKARGERKHGKPKERGSMSRGNVTVENATGSSNAWSESEIAAGRRPALQGIAAFLRALCVSAFLSSALLAQAEALLLTDVTIHTVSGQSITNGQVLVRDGKIAALGNSLTAPDARKISLAGQHLYPGMIALNTDLGLVEIDAVRATLDVKEVGEYTPDVYSWHSVNPDSELLAVARANGISHFEPTPMGAVVAGHSGLLALTGWTIEEMAVRKSIALHVYWPSANLDTTPKERARNPRTWKSLEDQDKERKEKLRQLDEFFAEARAYVKAKDNAKDFQIVPAWEAMLPVLRSELPVTIHADDVREIRSAVAWANTNQLKMILADARDAWQVADLLASNNVPVVFNHVFSLPPRDSDDYAVQYRGAATLHRAGVKFAFSGTGASLVKNLPYTAAQAVAFGLPTDEAIKALTLYPAQMAGVADRLGSIEVGKDATFFALDGDVLDIRSDMKRMWIGGKEVSLENRHTRLYEKYRNRPKTN